MVCSQSLPSKIFFLFMLATVFSIAMENPSNWLKKYYNQSSQTFTQDLLASLKYAQELADNEQENLPTYSDMKKYFDERDRAIKEDLISNGYSTELHPGVVELPILEWKSYTTVSDELDEFTIGQIEQSHSRIITRFFLASKKINPKPKSLLIRGPYKSGKTTLAKVVAYKTKKPYLIVPEIFFTSRYTFQRLAVYFSYARSFKNGAVILLENMPAMDLWADTTGINCIRNEIGGENAHKNKNLFVIITCHDKAQLSSNLLSRIQNFEKIDLPDSGAIFAHLRQHLAPDAQISDKFLEKLAINLKDATWQDINCGIARSKTTGQITEETINEGFKQIIKRLRTQRGEIDVASLAHSFYSSNEQFPN